MTRWLMCCRRMCSAAHESGQILKVLEAARPALEAEAVARKRAALRQGAPPTVDAVGRNSAQRGRVSEQIAKMAGVSMATMKDYHAVQTQGKPCPGMAYLWTYGYCACVASGGGGIAMSQASH